MPELFETNQVGGSFEGAYGTRWLSQGFTPRRAHNVTQVVLRAYRVASPGTVTVAIRATSGSTPPGEPTGADLATGTFSGNALTTDLAGEVVTVPLSTPVAVSGGVAYAIIIRAPNAGAPDSCRIIMSLGATQINPYLAADPYYSDDSGVTWALLSAGDYDLVFEEWGLAESRLHIPIGGKTSAGVVAARNS